MEVDRRQCLRCESSDKLQHHHVIPKALRRRVGPDYWNLFASVQFVDCEPPPGYRNVADRWAALPHYTQRLCAACHRQVHREIKTLDRRMREAQRSRCQCFECQFFREFDLGNLFEWFAPESPLAQGSIRSA